jgi:hypothetical protein
MSNSRALLAAVLTCARFALAEDAPPTLPVPTADEIKRVMDFQENGKARGPVLLDLIPCLKVDTTKASATAYNCLEPIKGPVKKGATVSAWMSWLCPRGGVYEDLIVQFIHEGQVRQTIDLKVEGLARVRMFRSHQLGKAGQWKIRVARGDKEVATTAVTVE